MTDKEKLVPSLEKITKSRCTGCGACANACPTKAITMEKNEEFFLEPVLDVDKCIGCNKCVQVCPVINTRKEENEVICYGLKATDEEIILKSSSGGAFTLLVNEFARQHPDNFYVVGVVYEDDFRSVKHICTNDMRKIDRMRISKYVQSDKKNIYNEVKDKLVKGDYVMFTGTPCEIMALNRFLCRAYSNLLTVDIICKGPTTPKALEDFVTWMEKKKKSKVTDINMRYKWKELDCWIPQYIRVSFNDKKPFIKEFYNTYVGNVFKILQRKSCGDCPVGIYTHDSDITMGDQHAANRDEVYYNKLGTSVLLVNTQKGKDFFADIDEKVYVKEEITIDKVYGRNRNHVHHKRDMLSEEIKKQSNTIKGVKKVLSIKDKAKMIVPRSVVRKATVLYRKMIGYK